MTVELYHGDCLDIMPTIEPDTFDLILTDPPYYKVKGEAWDRQWNTPAGFLAWLDQVFAEFYRLLKPNGSLYVFASPQMAARVEVLASERLNVLNRIRWVKDVGWHKKAKKEALHSYLSPWEEIIFAEHRSADDAAHGNAKIKFDIREYLVAERNKAGLTTRDVAEAWRIKTSNTNRTGMAGHWFERAQWALPTAENYEWLRQTFTNSNHGGEYLRREYEDLRRPFNVTADVPYTDVWTFSPVSPYPGKHPCEKPQDLLRHIIEASTRPGALVLDAFMGTGSTALACKDTGRKFVGIEKDSGYLAKARQRIAEPKQAELAL
ncbi:MAG: site-specific DNA-methyltransferase [Anaerolineae bacterium]|nr:site-specific DNA-methyltransferase [Anaerolineae bacterium]